MLQVVVLQIVRRQSLVVSLPQKGLKQVGDAGGVHVNLDLCVQIMPAWTMCGERFAPTIRSDLHDPHHTEERNLCLTSTAALL